MFYRALFNINNFVGSTVLAEVCALLSAIAIFTARRCSFIHSFIDTHEAAEKIQKHNKNNTLKQYTKAESLNTFTHTSLKYSENRRFTRQEDSVESSQCEPRLYFSDKETTLTLQPPARVCRIKLSLRNIFNQKNVETREEKLVDTRNKSIVPCWTMHTGTLPRRVFITMSIITMRSRPFPANSASDCLRFAKSRPQFSNLVAPSTSAKCLLHYKVHLLL